MAQWVESIQWMESILCQVGDDSAKLYILLTGPAGTSVLSGTTFNGTTLRSTFGFNLGSNYISLNEKIRHKES